MVGTEETSKAEFAGKHKYNHRSILTGDHPPVLKDLYVEILNKKNHDACVNRPWFGLVSLFNGISTFVGYLILKPSS